MKFKLSEYKYSIKNDELIVEKKFFLKYDIKIVLSDVDGVLTDGGMYYSEMGEESKKFNTKDGKGFELLRNEGLIVGIVTGENSIAAKRRGKKLKLNEIHIGILNKVPVVQEILDKYNLKWCNLAYIGDDLNDLEIIKKAGLSAAPVDGINLIKSHSTIVLNNKGGAGAFREFSNLILEMR